VDSFFNRPLAKIKNLPLGEEQGASSRSSGELRMSINQLNALFRVCGKKFVGGVRVWGVGCGVWWGFTDFEGVNYLIFREKVPEFSPDHSHIWYFLREKKSKSLTQQGFKIYSASPI
jgi:hypothetical protein